MKLPRRRPRFNGSPSDHAVTEQWPAQLRTGDMDGATFELGPASTPFSGASGTGLPEGAPDTGPLVPVRGYSRQIRPRCGQPVRAYGDSPAGICGEAEGHPGPHRRDDSAAEPRTEPITRLRAQPRYQPPQQPPPAGYSATTGPMPAIGRLAPAIGDALTRDETWGPKLAPLPCGHCATPPPVPGDILERTKIIGYVNWLALKAGWIVDNDWIWTCPPCQQDDAWKARQGTVAERQPRGIPDGADCEWHDHGLRGVSCTCPPSYCDRHDAAPWADVDPDECRCTCPGSVLATDVMLTSHDYLRTGRAISIRILRDTQAGPR